MVCQGHSHRSSFELDPIDEEAEGKHFKQKGSGLILAKYFGGGVDWEKNGVWTRV